MFLPLVLLIAAISVHQWLRRVAKVRELCKREQFAQRLHDLVKIAGSESSAGLRTFAIKLLDNDMKELDEALDVLQYELVGLQPKSQFRWRCAPKNFEVAIDGRLEGELIARRIIGKDD